MRKIFSAVIIIAAFFSIAFVSGGLAAETLTNDVSETAIQSAVDGYLDNTTVKGIPLSTIFYSMVVPLYMAGASVVAAVTRTPNPDSLRGKLYKLFIEYPAVNIGSAKEYGRDSTADIVNAVRQEVGRQIPDIVKTGVATGLELAMESQSGSNRKTK